MENPKKDDQFFEAINKKDSDSEFVPVWRDAILFMCIASTVLSAIMHSTTSDKPYEMWMYCLIWFIGWVSYMLLLVTGSYLNYKLRRYFGKNLTSVERVLVCNNLVDNVMANKAENIVPYHSWQITDENANKKGYVVVMGAAPIEWDPKGGDSYDANMLRTLIERLHNQNQENSKDSDID